MVIYTRHSSHDTRMARRHFGSTEDVDDKYDRGWWGVVVGGYHERMKHVPFEQSEPFPPFLKGSHTLDATSRHPEWKNMEAFPPAPDPTHPWQIVKVGDAVQFVGGDAGWYAVTRLSVTARNQKLVSVLSEDGKQVFDMPGREVVGVKSSYVSKQNKMKVFGDGFLIPGTRLKGPDGFYYVNRISDNGVVVDTLMRHNMSLLGPHVEEWKGVDSDVYYEEVYVPAEVFADVFKPVAEDMEYKKMVLSPQELNEEYGGTLDTIPELPPPKRAPLRMTSIFKNTQIGGARKARAGKPVGKLNLKM